MMEGYFVSWKGQTKGPLEKADVEQMLINGDISPLHALTLNGELVDIDRWIHSLREARAPATHSAPAQNVIAPQIEPMFSLPATKTTEESDLFSQQSGPDVNTPPHYPPPLPPPPPYFSQGPSYESAVSPQVHAPNTVGLRPHKSRTVYVLLGFFLGGFGIHNFYAGYTGKALAQLLIFIFLFWTLIAPLAICIWVLVEIITVKKDATGSEML